jgi:gamma-glutamylcyclotransferase (GGCT)/AIG2-like uncharacterized protein YtfP
MVMDKEKVLQALREAQAEYNIENLDEFIKKAWEEVDIVDAQIVAELTERAVEILFDQDFLWVHIIESEDCEEWIPDGWYSFVAVHPETHQCLTVIEDPVYSWESRASFSARIRSAEDAVDAVMSLAELIEQNLKSRAE